MTPRTDPDMRPMPAIDAHRSPRDVPRAPDFAPRRKRWPGLAAAGVLGAAIAAIAISSLYDERPIGVRLDAGVTAAQSAAISAAEDTAKATERVAGSLTESIEDAGITAAVKRALAADPSLSALKIDVSTEGGVVRLDGPAPDDKSRQRAEVLAAAPQGVTKVDNRLVVPPSPTRTN